MWLIYVAGGAVLGVAGAFAWLIWYFRDVMH
jgi:hypothetical protein